MNLKRFIGLFGLLAVFGLGSARAARAGSDIQPPVLPESCGSIQTEAGNEVEEHVYAIGVQIYRWNGSAWTFIAPMANLYADEGFRVRAGYHYAGPTWESNSGTTVLAARVPGTGCTPDSSAIPWLLLKTVSIDGSGLLRRTTFIQRVNTAGGLAPSSPGMTRRAAGWSASPSCR